MKNESVDTPLMVGLADSYIKYEPLGVVNILGSWNFPLNTTSTPLIQVIAAGNAAVVKPSEVSTWCSDFISRFVSKYLDQECYQCV